MEGPKSTLQTVLVISGIAVTVFSLLGIATMAGWLPHANSQDTVATAPIAPPATVATAAVPAATPEHKYTEHHREHHSASNSENINGTQYAQAAPVTQAAPICLQCGVVESIDVTKVASTDPAVLGTVAGGVLGALVGHQIGNGNGRTAMTVVGAAGGAYAGNQIQKNMTQQQRYVVHVRMDDGTYRTFYLNSPPPYGQGSRVRMDNGNLVQMS